MKNSDQELSETRSKRLEVQGFTGYSRYQLNNFKWGIRHAYFLCVSMVLAGLLLGSIEILAIVMTIAFFGVILVRHPFDYVYNYGTRFLLDKPRIPRRPNQSRFACAVATVLLAIIIFSMAQGYMIPAWIAAGILIFSAVLVSTTDICIPSIIYNRYIQREKTNREPTSLGREPSNY